MMPGTVHRAVRVSLTRLGASRVTALGGVAAVAVASWAWIVPMAPDMYGPMTGPSAWMMSAEWEPWRIGLLWLMWAVMMAAMMLPSAFPLLMLYDTVQRQRLGRNAAPVHVYAMAAGYVAVWAGFSVAATAAPRLLTRLLIMNPMMEMSSRTALAVTLLIAGAYQLTPWKSLCLTRCRLVW
jgi:predicted metal-binding membrane protein